MKYSKILKFIKTHCFNDLIRRKGAKKFIIYQKIIIYDFLMLCRLVLLFYSCM